MSHNERVNLEIIVYYSYNEYSLNKK